MALATFLSATFSRGSAPVLRDLNWSIEPGGKWAVLGGSGSGKSSLLEAVAGKLHLVSGAFEKPPTLKTVLVAFREQSRAFNSNDCYYQQRFEFADMEGKFSLADYLADAEPRFGLERLLTQPFITLSNGQMRKARLAKALAAKPDVILLDDPFLGLDVASRAELAKILSELPQTMIMTCREDDRPEQIENVLSIDHGAIVVGRAEALRSPTLSINDRKIFPTCAAELSGFAKPQPDLREPVIECGDVVVRHSGRIILDRIDWTVRCGEKWALSGPNGAGKTTLLSMLVGDHPQAFSNRVLLFGRQRGSGETIWDVKRRIGFVSPEFHIYFHEDLTALEAAETGFHDTLLHQPVSNEQRDSVLTLFEELDALPIANIKMRWLSTSQQRVALLIRALVKQPPLLVLDEPYQSLDAAQIARFNNWLETHLTPDQTLIITSHREQELPRIVTHHYKLAAGRCVSCLSSPS